MRLINVQTLAFEEFDGDEYPPYGILSHRWEEEEVTYQDVVKNGLTNIQKKGISKILACCKLSADYGLCYSWVDTCCIDKSSSAELSEAINSMYRWYQLARVCFAYLADITDGALKHSVWFSRSWTLQELIAPKDVLFYNSRWKSLGTKADRTKDISSFTGIPVNVLSYKTNIYSLAVAQRMSWASRRKCRRVEDIAYSLLGIFDVNMPLLYGEGSKAFGRLQEEIIRQYCDQTIFLWSSLRRETGRLLAPSPDCFDDHQHYHYAFPPSIKPFVVTNRGLSITLRLIPWDYCVYFVFINCHLTEFPASGTG